MKIHLIQSKKATFLSAVLMFLSFSDASGQNNEGYVFPQQVRPVQIDNYSFTGYYFNDRKVYNLRQSELSKSKGEVLSMKINPAGSSYAVLSDKNGDVSLKIYDLWRSDVVLHNFEIETKVPEAICYSPDSRSFAVAYNDRSILVYETKGYEVKSKFVLPFVADKIAISDNNYFLAAISGGHPPDSQSEFRGFPQW